MSYLRENSGADFEFDAGSDSSNDEAELAPFRLENIKDRPPIFDAEALHDALEEFGWSQPADFAQTQVVTLASTAQESVPDIHDDMARELAFYNGAKDAAEQAIAKLDQAGIQWHRPPDYYAESVKSDAHMAKVKQQLMFEQQAIEEAEQRRKNREMKAYSKQVQAEKQKERTRSKKDQISEITKLRKQRSSSGFAGELQFDKDMKVKNGVKPDRAGQRIRQDLPGKSKKRAIRDAKYGFGGRKKLGKQNTAESSADMNAMFKDKRKPGGKGKLGVKGGGTKKRPGKDARAAGRGGKRR